MKIAISTSGTDLNAPVDPRFGRAAAFLIVDTETGESTIEPNEQNLNAPQGAGIQAAQNVAATGAEALISGHCGPKAFRILSASNIAIYTSNASTIQEAINQFNADKLTKAESADVEGHWV